MTTTELQQTQSTLLNCAPELRDKIWKLAFGGTEIRPYLKQNTLCYESRPLHHKVQKSNEHYVGLQLQLSTCKTIRREVVGQDLIYKNNVFQIDDAATFKVWMGHLCALEREAIKEVVFGVTKPGHGSAVVDMIPENKLDLLPNLKRIHLAYFPRNHEKQKEKIRELAKERNLPIEERESPSWELNLAVEELAEEQGF